MAEEHKFQSPENHRLCANNCGFFGSSTTHNLCSKCFKDSQSKSKSKSPDSIFAAAVQAVAAAAETAEAADGSSKLVAPAANRCLSCRKKVGLIGFRCRCGATFCRAHRYPENHGCSFDFKGMGREAIAKANPIVKAAKLEKI